VFGPFIIDTLRAELVREGKVVALRPKTFALLRRLAETPGILVSKQELMDAVWPGLVVTDDSLTQAISELRGALDDRDQKIIKTIPRRGYLFDVVVRPEASPSSNGSMNGFPTARRGLWAAGLGAVILVSAGSIAFVVARVSSASDPPIASALVESRSLAVIPFTDLSEPPAPHLAQAIDTDLSVDLGRLADNRAASDGLCLASLFPATRLSPTPTDFPKSAKPLILLARSRQTLFGAVSSCSDQKKS
jgi:DNA-binding winged helix-turn-helix (wHTH) protein